MNSSFAKNITSNAKCNDHSGEHSLVIKKGINKNHTGKHLSVKQVKRGNVDWVLNDYVNDCDVSIKLDVISESIEVNRHFSNKEDASMGHAGAAAPWLATAAATEIAR